VVDTHYYAYSIIFFIGFSHATSNADTHGRGEGIIKLLLYFCWCYDFQGIVASLYFISHCKSLWYILCTFL